MTWYVVQTNIKCETKAEGNLRAAGFRTYAPLQRFEKFNKRKKTFMVNERRICGRYLFVEAPDNADAWGAMRACQGVEHIVPWGRPPIRLNKIETKALEVIMAAEADYAFDETRTGKLHRREIGKTKKETTKLRFPVGARVRIKDGPFTSFGGEISNVTGKGALKVLLTIFGRITETELESGQVELAQISEAA